MCSRIGTIVKVQGGKLTAIKMTCRSWGCETCSKERARALVAEVKEGMPQRFITLTVNPNWFDSPEERARRLIAAWRLIRRRFLKLHPNAVFEFMAVFEKTKKGEPHLHIAQRGAYIPQKWLSAQLHELIGAPIVDIRYIRDMKKVAMYVAKYVSKDPTKFGTLKRYWRSLKYLKMSKAAARKLRNAGATFYILECHWKGYLKNWLRHSNLAEPVLRKAGFQAEWSDDEPPPWCLTVIPIVCS